MEGCFPTFKATRASLDTLSHGDYIDVQAKVFKSDNSIILYREGFSINDSFIKGKAIEQRLGARKSFQKTVEVDIDSIIAMVTYEETTSGTRYFGSFLFGLTGPALTFAGLYCLACPKCCFGSCPTIYTLDGQNYYLEAELFSECISKQLENGDIDLLRQEIVDEQLSIKITNEALETHYIDKLNLVIIEHPEESEVYPDINDQLIIVKEPFPPQEIKSKDGRNVKDKLLHDDCLYYRSGVDMVNEIRNGPAFDYLDIKLPNVINSPLKMVVKYRNTLLSTTLLYDVVIGSQGASALEWTNRMNNDSRYASQFNSIYRAFSGIKLKIFDGFNWIETGTLKDAGPLNWKFLAAEIPIIDIKAKSIRLEFIPDNFMIDYIAFDTTRLDISNICTIEVQPNEIINQKGEIINSLNDFIWAEDNKYLKTEPGDCYYINYYVPFSENKSQTALLYSEGYYNEWIRGSWIREKQDYIFNLYDIRGTFAHLADSWLENSAQLEAEFFNSRIILEKEK